MAREDPGNQAEVRGDSALELRWVCLVLAPFPSGVSTPILFSSPALPSQVLWAGPEWGELGAEETSFETSRG